MSNVPEKDQVFYAEATKLLIEDGMDGDDVRMVLSLLMRTWRVARNNDFLIHDEIIEQGAKLAFRQFKEYQKAGFTEDQALLLCAHAPIRFNIG